MVPLQNINLPAANSYLNPLWLVMSHDLKGHAPKHVVKTTAMFSPCSSRLALHHLELQALLWIWSP